jgi:hypothetical protein
MELVPILRRLWQRRIALAAGLVLAIAAAFAVGPGAPARSAVAAARVVLLTPDSQLVNADPPGADSLQWRTGLLAHRLATDPVRDKIAAAAAIPPERLIVVDPVLEEPAAPTTLPLAASEAAAIRPEPYSITVRYDTLLPVISLEVHAPDRAAAVRLAKAAQDELVAESVAGDGKTVQGYDVAPIGPPSAARDEVKAAPPTKAIAALIAVFGLWCAALAVASWLRRRAHPRLEPA